MVSPTMPISTYESESFHYMIENITTVEQYTIRFPKHHMFPHSLYLVLESIKVNEKKKFIILISFGLAKSSSEAFDPSSI